MSATSKKMAVIVIGKDRLLQVRDTTTNPTGDVEVDAQTYLMSDAQVGLLERRDSIGKKYRTRCVIVREGIPLPIPLGSEVERKWPDSRALNLYYRAQFSRGLAAGAGGGQTGIMDTLLGVNKWVWAILGGILLVAVYLWMNPSYIDLVLGRA